MMRDSTRLLFGSFILLVVLGCTGTPAVLDSPVGLWIMDEGELGLIGRAAFIIDENGEFLTINFGEMTEGRFIPEDGAVTLIRTENGYNLDVEGDFIEIESDESGLLFRRSVGDSYITYHFSKSEE